MQPRSPQGVNQPPGFGRDYPFIGPSPDVDWLLADFFLSYDDPQGAFVLPFRIAWLHGFGSDVVVPPDGLPTPTHIYDLLVVDANGSVVFDSTQALEFVTLAWGSDRFIVEWRNDPQVCRLVAYDPSAWPDNVTPETFPTDVVPDNGVLDERTYLKLPPRVLSLTFGALRLTGNFQFTTGNSCAITASSPKRSDGGRFINSINFDGTPGGGLGPIPGCGDATALIRRINGAGPSASGNFILDLSGCYRDQLPVGISYSGAVRKATLLQGHRLDLFNDCEPCCKCSDYVRVYKGLKHVWDEWASDAAEAEAVRDALIAAIARWNAQLTCRLAQTSKLVTLGETQCAAQVAASYCNMTSCCLRNVEVRLTHQVYDASGTLVPYATLPGYTSVGKVVDSSPTDDHSAVIAGAWPVFKPVLRYLDPRASGTVQYRLCVPGCHPGYSVQTTLTVHATAPAGCPIAASTVPADILALWSATGNTTSVPAVGVIQKMAPLTSTANTYPCPAPGC